MLKIIDQNQKEAKLCDCMFEWVIESFTVSVFLNRTITVLLGDVKWLIYCGFYLKLFLLAKQKQAKSNWEMLLSYSVLHLLVWYCLIVLSKDFFQKAISNCVVYNHVLLGGELDIDTQTDYPTRLILFSLLISGGGPPEGMR